MIPCWVFKSIFARTLISPRRKLITQRYLSGEQVVGELLSAGFRMGRRLLSCLLPGQ